MEVVQVPSVPEEAFNKHRPMSDLIKSQVKHFKHLEEKLSPAEREKIPQHRITSENDAATYIAAMTRLLVSAGDSQAQPKPKAVTMQPKDTAKTTPQQGLAIAASAAKTSKSSGRSNSKAAAKKHKK